jgi:methionyl-tRNA synthetase
MSKSVDNVVKPLNLADVYGVAALRFYLMSGLAPGRDADFDEDVLRTRYQSALRLRCDGLGHEVVGHVAEFAVTRTLVSPWARRSATSTATWSTPPRGFG